MQCSAVGPNREIGLFALESFSVDEKILKVHSMLSLISHLDGSHRGSY